MANVEAQRFADLKARVRAECLRRCYTGSVAAYGGVDYDYTNPAETGHTIDTEHYEKLAFPLAQINSSKVNGVDGDRVITDEDITAFESALTLFEARAMTDKTRGDCEASCTGACYTGCTSECGGTCTQLCSEDCSSQCTTGCGKNCKNECSDSCKDGCYGCGGDCTELCRSCGGGCDDTCLTGCQWSCQNGCEGNCKKTCTQTCGDEGCVGSCLSLCYQGCTTSCQKQCGYCGNNCTEVST